MHRPCPKLPGLAAIRAILRVLGCRPPALCNRSGRDQLIQHINTFLSESVIVRILEASTTRKQIARFFADPQHPLQRRFEAMRLFFQERRPAREVAERLGYSLSAVYNMVIKVDFDLAITITAYNLYRLLAHDLPAGHSHLTARTLFERMLCTGATVRLGRDTCVVTLNKKRNLPALLETPQAQEPVRIPWIGNRRILYEGDTRS